MNGVGRNVIGRSEVFARLVAFCFAVGEVSRWFFVDGILVRVAARRRRTECICIVARSFHFECLFIVVQILETTTKNSRVRNIVSCSYISITGPVTERRGTLANRIRAKCRSTSYCCTSGAIRVVVMMVDVLLNRVRTDRWSQRYLFLVDELTVALEVETFVQ